MTTIKDLKKELARAEKEANKISSAIAKAELNGKLKCVTDIVLHNEFLHVRISSMPTDEVKASLHKARLAALHTFCLHLFRHFARKLLEIHEYSCVVFVQTDEKSDCAIRIQSLCGAALKFYLVKL